jgi:hypothetical protein
MAAPTPWHQIASANLVDILRARVKARKLGLVRSDADVVTARVSGTEPVDLPPFVGLGLVPASLWQYGP